MTLTLDLPKTTMDWLQSEADARGIAPSSVVEKQLSEAYARAEAQAILNGPFSTLAESNARFRQKYGLPDISHLSREELDHQINDAISEMDPPNLAEAIRQGLL